MNKYLDLIEKNKNEFIIHNSEHNNHNNLEIFQTYCFLQVSSSTLESEKPKMTHPDAYTNLPEKLKKILS